MTDEPTDAFAQTLDELPTGQFGPRYRLLATLGSGAMGTVHRVHDTELDEVVALKVLRSELAADRQSALRLRREVKLSRRVTHANVARVFDLQIHDDSLHITMEFVDGGSLQQMLQTHQRLSSSRVIELSCQICEGLQAAHDAGVVHRDLKPDNVLVTSDGVVKLADFGIATTMREDPSGEFVGTPYYVAPEQARGQAVDGRADIYALGAMMFEMLVGHPPWDGDTVMQLVMRRLVEPPPTIPESVAVSERLQRIVSICMARDPDDRFVSATAVLEELKRSDEAGRTADLAPATVNRLPTATNTFIGREHEIADLRERLLGDQRLVTLLGPGGTGKTRLSLEVGRSLADELSSLVFVELADATTADDLLERICRALDTPADPQRLDYAIRVRGDALLILDNLEQVVAPARDLINRCLSSAPGLRILATSRIRLGAAAEHVFPLSPLSREQAVALFESRARMLRPNYVIGAAAPTVEKIVDRVDCLPLAVEIVAAQMRLIDEDRALARLEDRFRALRGGSRDRPDRHATMESVLDGSWELLSDAARTALSQLSVFRGGATIEVACQVVEVPAADAWPEELIEQLWDHSLLRFVGDRIELLDLVREYAAEKLGDPEPVFERHGAALAELADRLRRGTVSDRAELVVEHSNLVAACERALQRRDAAVVEATLRALLVVHTQRGRCDLDLYLAALTVSEDGPWRRRVKVMTANALCVDGRDAEAASLLAEVLDAATPSEARTRCQSLFRLSEIHQRAGEAEVARRYESELLDTATSTGADDLLALAWRCVGLGRWRVAEFESAQSAFERSYASATTDHERGLIRGQLGLVLADRGQSSLAEDCFRQALDVHRRSGDLVYEALTLSNLGMALRSQRKYEAALDCWKESLAIHERTGDLRGASLVRLNLGSLLVDRDDIDAARAHLTIAHGAFTALSQRRFEAIVLGTLGLADAKLREFEDARAKFDVAESILREVSDGFSLGRLLAKRGSAEAWAGQSEEAQRYLDQARELAAQTGASGDSPLIELIEELASMVEAR